MKCVIFWFSLIFFGVFMNLLCGIFLNMCSLVGICVCCNV